MAPVTKTMNGKHQNGVKTRLTSGYVLEQHTPLDVARAMIESGQQKQAFYIFNMDEVYRRVQYFKEVMPRVKIFYAMKANDTDMMLRIAVALGLGFDCASPNEIYKLRKLNADPKSIIYAMPCKTPEEMEYAQKTGVNYTTFDSSCELKKIKKYWPDARLLLRIRVDGKSIIVLGLKYGCDFHTEATELLDEAASLGLKVAGVTFHVGSICFSPESYVVGLQQARALFDHEAKAGRRMTIVDIGGGFVSDRADRIDEVGRLVNGTLEELFPDPDVQVVAEPGRYLCDSAFSMFFSVMGVRQVQRNNEVVNMIYINNGKHMTMRFDESWHEIVKIQWTSEAEPVIDEEVMIWGPTCDCLDRIMKDRKVRLPQCAAGDWLMIQIHGGYTLSFSTSFSSMELPLLRTVVSKELWSNIKESSLFAHSDFITDSDISTPLPSTLPPIVPTSNIYEHSDATLQI